MGRCAMFESIPYPVSVLILVVTGASDGIGKEFAVQLAATGFNILLVARNEAALSSLAAEIGAFFL